MVSDHQYIVVSGNMGSGKSTLVKFLSHALGVPAFYEPVDNNPYFDRFFKDMQRWSFHSQIYFLTHKFKIHQEAQAQRFSIIDRSIYEDAEIFVKGLYENKQMTQDEFDLYWSLYESLKKTLISPQLIIYLNCNMDLLVKRIKNRARKGEENLSLDHLYVLQDHYDAWINRVNFCEVIKLNIDENNLHQNTLIKKLNIIFPPSKECYFSK